MRREWYDGYRQTFIERDLRQLATIENLPEFSRLFSLSLLRTGSVLNRQGLAADAALAYATAGRYLSILEVACQIAELPPFLPNIGKRLVKSPKLYAQDVGMAAHVANIASWNDAVSMGREGALLETWVLNELRTIDEVSATRSTFTYLRHSHGPEVDVVLERGTEVVGIEVKASATVTAQDFKGLGCCAMTSAIGSGSASLPALARPPWPLTDRSARCRSHHCSAWAGDRTTPAYLRRSAFDTRTR